MRHRIQHFRLGLEERKDPFDQHPELAGQHYLFLYLTGRGEFSYLFPDLLAQELMAEAEQTIPMGYTQLWILEWVDSLRPAFGAKVKPAQRRAVQKLDQGAIQEGHSYVLIGENALCFGWTDRLERAIGAARLLAVEKQVRVVIGLLKGNVTWH